MRSEAVISFYLLSGWISISLGILTGAVIGMCFHREGWFGGYASEGRRLLRLGHIAFFGMAFLNFSAAFTAYIRPADGFIPLLGAIGLYVATTTMPLVCIRSAFRGINRLLFFVPVSGVILLLASELMSLS